MAPKQPVAGPSRIKQQIAQSPPPAAAVSAFNPSRSRFALALPVLGAADKISIWDVPGDRVVAEWEVEGASHATTVCWTTAPATRTDFSTPNGDQGSRKKRKKRGGEPAEDVILITTEKGELFVFSPARSKVLRKIELPAPVTAAWSNEPTVLFTTSSAILMLDLQAADSIRSFPLPASTPSPTAIVSLSTSTSRSLNVVLGSLSIISLCLHLDNSTTSSVSPACPVATSYITSLLPLPATPQGESILVVSDDDRTVSQYTITSLGIAARLSYRYASPTLSPVHSVAKSSTLLSVLHTSGEISLFPIPADLDLARPKTASKPSSVKLVEGKDERLARIGRVTFSTQADGASTVLLCGRMAGAGRIKWHEVVYEVPQGGLRASTIVKYDAQDLAGSALGLNPVPLQRFSAPANAQILDVDIPDEPSAALPTDVDMADISLGERLLALPNGDTQLNGDVPVKRPTREVTGPVNAASLTRLMVQALHTCDPALLTLCLSHRDPVLIRNTIRKMPAQMALPLLKACVERLGQGKGANKRGGGRGSGQNEQQGRGTVEWVKGVLVERGALLMTIPSLPLHLAALSQLLSTRLQLYQPLLSLSGRLDLALAQISMRRIAQEQAVAAHQGGEGGRYIEGESEDEEDAVPVEVDEGGEVEDVDMRANGISDEDDEEEDDEGDNDDDDDDDGLQDEDQDEDPLDSGSEDGLLDVEAGGTGYGESGSEEDEED